MEPRTKDEVNALRKYRSATLLTKDEIMTLQKLRNASLLGENSPIPPNARGRFKGVDFFAIDQKYQYRLRLNKYENPEPVRISLSNDQKVDALKAGYFDFNIEGRRIRLYVYKKRPNDTEVFLPFKDKTSGDLTYGGGRFLDLYVATDDSYVLDFNLACSPLCQFDEKKYDCPIPPSENWLMDVEIRAGEMKVKR
jgi:uncharacterized protein